MSIWAAAKGDGGSFAYISGGVTHEHYLSPPGKQPATHKSLLLWNRWVKINQLPHPCPRTPFLLPCYTAGLHAAGEPSPNLGNRPLIVSPLTWPLGLGLGTPALSPQTEFWPFAAAGMGVGCTWGTRVWGSMVSPGVHARAACAFSPCPPAPPTSSESQCEVQEERPPQKRSLYVICTRPGHTHPWWLRNTVDIYKTDAKWILLHTGTVVTPQEVFKKNCPDSFLSGRKHGGGIDVFLARWQGIHCMTSGTWAPTLLAVCAVSKSVTTHTPGHTEADSWGTRMHNSPQTETGTLNHSPLMRKGSPGLQLLTLFSDPQGSLSPEIKGMGL